MLDWLDVKWLTIAQILSTLTIAWVGARIAIGNSVGFKPIIIIVGRGVSNVEGGLENSNVHCTFEVWNRRKYPVVFSWAKVRFGGVKLIQTADKIHALGGWFPEGDEIVALYNTVVIDPGKHQRFEAIAARYGRDVEIFEPRMLLGVQVCVLDPYKGRTLTLRGVPEWKKPKRALLWRLGLPV